MNSIDRKKTAEDLTSFIKKSFKQAGLTKAVIALSGGVDSTVSCTLIVRALGANNVYTLLLPYADLNQEGVVDTQEVIKRLGIPEVNVSLIDIKSLVDPMIILDSTMDNVRKGNIMARVRMILLFDAAKKHKALVVGTENKTEHLLGYFTRFGDEASDIEPLRNLYKTQVYEVAKHLGVPGKILTKAPTAGLWPGQTDEEEFGFTYKEADKILALSFDEKKAFDEIVARGFNTKLVDKILLRASVNDFKHHLPIIP